MYVIRVLSSLEFTVHLIPHSFYIPFFSLFPKFTHLKSPHYQSIVPSIVSPYSYNR